MPRKFDFISPGVQITELDQSKLEPALEEDGLLIIGRAPTGPALKPIRVNSLDNFIDVFGKPVSGKGTANSDIWRDGNNQGPTYGMYAAQAWLASNTSPVTFVRLLGEDSPEAATTATKAGWDLDGANYSIHPNLCGMAYGLFIAPSASANLSPSTGNNTIGTLAAVFYTTGSALSLNGTIANTAGESATTSSCAVFIQSISTAGQPATFKIDVQKVAGDLIADESLIFHFDSSKKDGYIRNVCNTSPQKTLASQVASGKVKTYFLGETFEEAVERRVTSVQKDAGKQIGVLLALGNGITAASSWMNHQSSAKTSKSGWFISRDPNPTNDVTTFNAALQKRLFRLVALSEGEYFEQNHYVTVEDLVLGTVKNPNSRFSICIRDKAGSLVEKFSNLDLDASSENFVAKKIGDMYHTWDNTKDRYELYGEYPNQSNYVRVEMHADWKAGIDDAYMIPWGHFGPTQPTGWTYIAPQAVDQHNGGKIYPFGTLDSGSAGKSDAYVQGGATALGHSAGTALNFIKTTAHFLTASFEFPRLKLTEQSTNKNASDYLPTDMFGLRHKTSGSNSSKVLDDKSYIDLIRFAGAGLDVNADADNVATQYSYVFTLDEIVKNKSTGRYYWASGSHALGVNVETSAETAGSGSQQLLTNGVKKFAAPFFGGFDGINIRRTDPFSNSAVLSNKTEENHYAYYSISKAIDAVSDAEVVQYDVISIPNLTNEGLSNKLMSAVEDRGDALALIDLNDDYLETYENSGTRTGGELNTVLATARSRDLNTSYAATHYPRVRLRDTLSGKGDVIIAPATVAAAGALAFSDANSEGPWFAPAGFNRGGISVLGGNDGPRVAGTWKNLAKSDRDDLYELNINPIARFPAVGEVVIFGQKTLQQTPSALDRINVRRLMVYLKKKIGKIADTILFDQNVQATWSRFKSSADLVLEDVQSRFGISEYKLILDDTTTTPDLVDQNIMYAKIYVKPARAIEFIAIDFIITKSGVEF